MEIATYNVPEKTSIERNLRFEPGAHPQTDSGHSAVYESFYNGNIDSAGSYSWNKEVGERISSYAYNKPGLLLTIDGLAPQSPTTYPRLTPLMEAVYTWVDLPTRPNKLNSTGKVYVVKGDSDYYDLPQAVLPNIKESASLLQEMGSISEADGKSANAVTQEAIIAETAGIAALWGLGKLTTSLVSKQKISRRNFLSGAINTVTGAAIVGSLSRYELPIIPAMVPNEQTKELLQTGISLIRPRVMRPASTDGRTALLIAKAEDAQTSFPDPSQVTNTVIMGWGHTDMFPTYTQSKTGRDTAIATFAKDLLDTAKQIYAEYYHVPPQDTPSQVVNSVLDYVSQVDIVQVSDPGGPSLQPAFPQTVDKQITPVKSFHSPQVEEAIKELRPRQ